MKTVFLLVFTIAIISGGWVGGLGVNNVTACPPSCSGRSTARLLTILINRVLQEELMDLGTCLDWPLGSPQNL